ncbi:MAG: hypothetical protein Q8K78_00760 [Planctomycetaceae bacterium]|nr:hypothetical protein [Planctomycetaceae bacterium]
MADLLHVPMSPGSVPTVAKPAPGRGRKRTLVPAAAMRVTAMLSPAHSVTVSGPDLDLPRVIALLSEALSKARKSHAQQMSLATFVSLLRDQAAVAFQRHRETDRTDSGQGH